MEIHEDRMNTHTRIGQHCQVVSSIERDILNTHAHVQKHSHVRAHKIGRYKVAVNEKQNARTCRNNTCLRGCFFMSVCSFVCLFCFVFDVASRRRMMLR